MTKRVITCASYYGTGSSAVTDFFTEFSDICSLGDYEYRFLQEPDGIADLEYNVVENNHRHNTSDAIKRFVKYTVTLEKMGYGGYDIFEGKFREYTNRFIDEIVGLKTYTWWNKDRIDRGRLFCFMDRVYSYVKRLMTGNLKTEKRFSLLTGREIGYYTAISSDAFLEAVRRYVRDLLAVVNKEDKPYVMVDQMVPPTNVGRFVKYFDDVRVIVVDRDPRDIFLLERELWQWGIIPVNDVKEFVEWFKITRKNGRDIEEDKTHIMRVSFEDLVYKYDETTARLMDFVGISSDKHISPKTVFNPEASKKNTNLKAKYPKYEAEIKYIEENLSDFLYSF